MVDSRVNRSSSNKITRKERTVTTPSRTKSASDKAVANNETVDTPVIDSSVVDSSETVALTETPTTENVDETVEVSETPKNRIPDPIANNDLLRDFASRYLDGYDEIAAYNKAVLAEKTSEWNVGKVLEQARNFARPTDKNSPVNNTIKQALEKYESLVNEVAKARKNVLDLTSQELGISLSATSDRDPETEARLKDVRKTAIEIGTQLSMIAKMTASTNEEVSKAVDQLLAENPMPAIGRDQVRTFGDNGGKATPKYRVTVTVSKDGTQLESFDGFTKAALALTKPAFGYERGSAPKSDKLRAAWEKAGNTPEKTVKDPVEFDDNGLHFVITKK